MTFFLQNKIKNVGAARILSVLFLLCGLLAPVLQAQDYRELPQNNLWYLYLDSGMVVIALNERYAPDTVAQIRQLTSAGFYNGRYFYRVIDGFVAQAGVGDAELTTPPKPLALEANTRLTKEDALTLVQRADLFAPYTGFLQGFAVGVADDNRTSWLLHCPGVVGMARGDDPDSASSEFYIVLGQAPRYLDNIMTLFGRVVWGMDKVQAILRADPMGSGVMADNEPKTRIRWAAMGDALPAEQRLSLQLERTDGPAFEQKLKDRRERPQAFFFRKPPQVLDACQVPVRVQLNKPAQPKR